MAAIVANSVVIIPVPETLPVSATDTRRLVHYTAMMVEFGWALLTVMPTKTPVQMALRQGSSPTDLVGVTQVVRAVGAFGIVLLLGGATLWRYESYVDGAIDEAIDRPLRSMAYGAAAHLVFAFAGFYLVARLGQLTVSGTSAGGIGFVIWAVGLLLVGSLGFTIVGSILVGLYGERQKWYGLIVGALIASAIALGPTLVAIGLWLIIVSMGIGGPVRQWYTASITSTA